MTKRPAAPTTPEQWTELVTGQYAKVRETIDPMLAKIIKDTGLEFDVEMKRRGEGGLFTVTVLLKTELNTETCKRFEICVEMVSERCTPVPLAYGHSGVVKFKHQEGVRGYHMTRQRGWDAKWFPELERNLEFWATALVETTKSRAMAEEQAPKIEAYLKGLPVSEDLVQREVTVKLSWDKTRFETIRVLETRKTTQHDFTYLLDSEGRLWLSKTVITPLRNEPCLQV